MSIKDLQPKEVFENFYSLTQIPRPSKKEAQVISFMKKFGEDLGLETIVDAAGNVIIRKPAAEPVAPKAEEKSAAAPATEPVQKSEPEQKPEAVVKPAAEPAQKPAPAQKSEPAQKLEPTNKQHVAENKAAAPSNPVAKTVVAADNDDDDNKIYTLKSEKKLAPKVNVLGKIDLSSLNQSTRPKKKSKEERRKEREQKSNNGGNRHQRGAQKVDINEEISRSNGRNSKNDDRRDKKSRNERREENRENRENRENQKNLLPQQAQHYEYQYERSQKDCHRIRRSSRFILCYMLLICRFQLLCRF